MRPFPPPALIDVEAVLVDGWLPDEVRADMVRRMAVRMADIRMPGIDLPEIRAGSIGHDARALGAASQPLSERFLVDRDSLFRGA